MQRLLHVRGQRLQRLRHVRLVKGAYFGEGVGERIGNGAVAKPQLLSLLRRQIGAPQRGIRVDRPEKAVHIVVPELPVRNNKRVGVRHALRRQEVQEVAAVAPLGFRNRWAHGRRAVG